MELVGALRLLWRRRWLVCVGVALAVAAGTLVVYRVDPGGSPIFESRKYDVGVASTAVLVDSQSSQVVDLGGGEVKTDVIALAARGKLLANLMATSPLKEQVAHLAGIKPTTLTTQLSTADGSEQPLPAVTTGTTVDADDPEANILRLQTSETVPIISVNAQAADEATAAKLAASSVAELARYLRSVAAGNEVPDARQLVITALGSATSETIRRGPEMRTVIGVGAFLLLAWCVGIVVVFALIKGWRQAAADEHATAGGPRPPHLAVLPDPGGAMSEPEPTDRARPTEGSDAVGAGGSRGLAGA